VQKTFHHLLDQNGIQAIECLKQPFDPNQHEAIGETETDDVEEGHVAEEVQRGYILNGRVVRPSKVKLAKKSKQ